MKKIDVFRIVLVIAALLLSLWYLKPTVDFMNMDAAQKESMDAYKLDRLKDRIIKLGLDLQGGMHLVLEVDKSKLTKDEAKDAVDRAIEVIRNRVDQYGVSEPIIQKLGESRIIVELPGLSDKQRAKELIGRTALLEFVLLEDAELMQETIDKIDMALAAGADSAGSTAGAEKAADVKAEKTAGAEDDSLEDLSTMFEEEGADAAAGDGATSASRRLSGLLARMGGDVAVAEENIPRVQALLADSVVRQAVPARAQFMWGSKFEVIRDKQYKFLYLMRAEPEMTGAGISDARPELGGSGQDFQTGPYVSLEMNAEGADDFDRVTRSSVNKRLAIVLDKKVHSAPVIRNRIPNGRAQITGSFTMNEAKDLAIVLRSGALPAPVKVIEERTIGASLGSDSIASGVKAALMGLAVVVLFVLVYYKLSGFLANLALALNIVFILAVLAGFHATLTMPGIAGIILTIGMAIDANVLIFERIREELALGKTIRTAIDTGYSRAFRTILDANVTTFITAVVLYNFGTGAIRGFAVTLSIGIMASMFSALVITRVVYDVVTAKFNLKKLSI